jgi:hypothetical protein
LEGGREKPRLKGRSRRNNEMALIKKICRFAEVKAFHDPAGINFQRPFCTFSTFYGVSSYCLTFS